MLHLLKKKMFCSCYCLRLAEFCKRRISINWTTMSKKKNKYRSSTSHNMKKCIFSYNNILSTIRALLIAARRRAFMKLAAIQVHYNTGKSHDDDAD